MKTKDKLLSILVVILLIYIVCNIGTINNMLSVSTDKDIQFGHTSVIIPEAWNTTDELNMTNQSKTKHAFTNGYVIWDIWEDWPESHITDISRAKFAELEHGGYKVINSSNITLGGINVDREYYTNPSRDTETQWDHIGVNYLFSKENTNYLVQIHYFTDADYNNQSFVKELDDRFEDMIGNIHNKDYDGFFTPIMNFLTLVSKN